VKLSKIQPPDLSDFRKRYPQTVANFGVLGNREQWLRRIWELDARWQGETRGVAPGAEREVIVRGAPPVGLNVEAEFEIIYAGGALGLLHAAVMAARYGRRVMLMATQAVTEKTPRQWNISEEELREFERAGLFTKEELERAVVNRYRAGFVKFHDAASRVKTPPLWINGVLDVALNADELMRLAVAKIQKSETGSVLLEGVRFVRCYVQRERAVIEVEEVKSGKRTLFAARLYVDAKGNESGAARQLNDGRKVTHVCPTVGTLARGFERGAAEACKVDFNVGEILVSREDARDHRQLIWEGLAGDARRDEYATSLFFYDAVDSPADKSLLALFEHYFESLPRYKRAGAQWRVVKPVFGYVRGYGQRGWNKFKSAADDRVMLIGGGAGFASPLTLGGFGAHIRNLRRLTHLTDLALTADLLDAGSLSEINTPETRVAQAASLAEFMRPTVGGAPAAVNETLNAVMAALHDLDERVRRELFQDRLSFMAFKNLLSRTAKLYPRIFQRMREHLGARGTFWWLAQVAEGIVTERRVKIELEPIDAAPDEDAAEKFARFVRHYKVQRSENE
jgi:lycopene cyclase CruA